MDDARTQDELFRTAVSAIDAGDVTALDWAEYSGGKPGYDQIATYLRLIAVRT